MVGMKVRFSIRDLLLLVVVVALVVGWWLDHRGQARNHDQFVRQSNDEIQMLLIQEMEAKIRANEIAAPPFDEAAPPADETTARQSE
jgi:hypothetical protein